MSDALEAIHDPNPADYDPDLGLQSERLRLLADEWQSTGWLAAPWCEDCKNSFRVAGVYSTPA